MEKPRQRDIHWFILAYAWLAPTFLFAGLMTFGPYPAETLDLILMPALVVTASGMMAAVAAPMGGADRGIKTASSIGAFVLNLAVALFILLAWALSGLPRC